MLDNCPVIAGKFDELTVEGYSRAAVQTYWRIPELKLGFDLGAHPWDFMGTPNWLITHAHLDHIAALPLYLARRRMMKMEPPKVFLPDEIVDGVFTMLDGFTMLDRGRLPATFVGVKPGDEIELSRELVLTVGRTRHTVPSVCYLVWDRRRKLKAEFLNLDGQQIKRLREQGIEITDEIRMPLVAYMGDTAPVGLEDNPDIFRAKILISEMTFVAPDHRRHLIHKHGHMHVDDYVALQDRFENDVIVCGHFSTRYSRQQAIQLVERRLPGMLDGRLKVWL